MFIYNDLMDNTFTIVAGSTATDSKVIILVLVFIFIIDSEKIFTVFYVVKRA